MIIYRCDRCQTDFKTQSELTQLALIPKICSDQTKYYELCQKCLRRFDDFMNMGVDK